MMWERCRSDSHAIRAMRAVDEALERLIAWGRSSSCGRAGQTLFRAVGGERFLRWWRLEPGTSAVFAGSLLGPLDRGRDPPVLPVAQASALTGVWIVAWAACALAATLGGGGTAIAGAAGTVAVWTLLALQRPTISLGLLFLSCAVSPRVALPFLGEDAPLRVDDLAAPALGIALLVKWLRPRKAFPCSDVVTAMAVYFLAGSIATGTGLIAGTVHEPLLALAHLLKRLEPPIFFVFALVTVDREEARSRMGTIIAFILTGVAAAGVIEAIRAWWRLGGGWPGPDARPFNQWPWVAESNHMAALLLVGALWAGGRFLAPSMRFAWLPVAAVLAAGTAVTSSRSALLGAAAGLGVVALHVGSWRIPLGIALAAVLAWPVLPTSVRLRLSRDFLEEVDQHRYWSVLAEDGFQHRYTPSRNRIECWSMILDDARRHPILGTGWGSRHRTFYESQFMMELGEVGLLGLCAFSAVLLALARRLDHSGEIGLLAGLAALAVMGLTMNSFVIARTAGPFWILAGCALGSPPARKDL